MSNEFPRARGGEPHFRIGELAEHCGLSRRTIDYYTQLGLLSPVARTSGNYRLYAADAPARIAQIRALQARRLSLTEITARLSQEGNGHDGDLVEHFQHVACELDRLHGELAEIWSTVQGRRLEHAKHRALSQAARDTLRRTNGLATLLSNLVLEAPTDRER